MSGLAAWMGRRGSLVLIGAIALLLPTLAYLQYEWTGELSQLEQMRARSSSSAVAQQFSTRFDAMLAGLYSEFHARMATENMDELAPAHPLPEGISADQLVKSVYLIDKTPDGGYDVRHLEKGGVRAQTSDWPEWLDERDLERTLLDDMPALIVRRVDHPGQWTAVLLDMDTMASDVLPSLLASSMEGGIPLDYDMLITRDNAPDHVVYQSRADLALPMFESWVHLAPMFAVHGSDLDPAAARSLHADAGGHRWRISIKGQEGALEAAVGAARARNLGIGAGVLALLAISFGLLVYSARRAERGVRDQLEVVARMSHELRTPLATITCAGENLAADVVGLADVQQYGEIIQREGRRLNKTVADIMLCCRLQTRADAALELRPTDVGPVIDRAVEDSIAVSGGTGVIERAVEPGLPTIAADAEALRAALKNLLVNALRHGGGGPVLAAARARPGGSGVTIEIEDRGPGIPEDELPRVFDSFFRGRHARDGQVEGSGIGLSVVYHVVRSHGGTVSAHRVHPSGTRFTVQLPIGRKTAPVEDGAEA